VFAVAAGAAVLVLLALLALLVLLALLALLVLLALLALLALRLRFWSPVCLYFGVSVFLIVLLLRPPLYVHVASTPSTVHRLNIIFFCWTRGHQRSSLLVRSRCG